MLEAAENVRIRVRKALLNRSRYEITDLKNLLDSEAQIAIQETLRKADVPVRVISEEGNYEIGKNGPILVIDPLDGTTNMARGIPFACTSMAISKIPFQSGVTIGLIKDLYTGEVFRAERNKGAWRMGKRISPSPSRLLNEALISLDISKGIPVDRINNIITSARHLRQMGSSALSLCHLASGMIDAHIDIRGKLRITDVSAGLLILREAGGAYLIEDIIERNLELSNKTTLKLIAASSNWTLEEIKKTIG
jgi:myo-inositol-1(or 4)-monophosphatase